ncbi:MAG TPA: hypothetical protein VEC37_19830, partial [Bacillota bacterium]|nr:hypothetical protein [Bacillota bacterium]
MDSTFDFKDAVLGDGNCIDIAFGKCTLRSAIIEANMTPEHDTIILPGGIYTLTNAGAEENAAISGDLDITNPLTIVGSNGNKDGDPTATVIDGGIFTKVFTINPAWDHKFDTVIQAITIRNANNTSTVADYMNGGAIEWDGGGTSGNPVGGTLEIYNSVISNNSANGSGGGLFLYNNGATEASVTITKSVISNNSSLMDGGGIYVGSGVKITIADSTLDANVATGKGGGLRFASGATALGSSINNSTVSNNTAERGGGIYVNTPISIMNSTISGNKATLFNQNGIYASLSGGGLLTVKNSTIANNKKDSLQDEGLYIDN